MPGVSEPRALASHRRTSFERLNPAVLRRPRRRAVGPALIARRRLTADSLAASIREAATDAAMRRNATALGAGVREERGVARAVAILTSEEAPGRWNRRCSGPAARSY